MNSMKKMALLLLIAAASNSASAQNKVVLEAGTPYTITSAAEVASSGGTVLYQWYRNGSKIEGATGLSYTVLSEDAVGSNVKFQRAAYLEGCEERKFSNTITITWCNLLLNGVCWADVNVAQPGTFAPRPDMYTEFYQWNQPAKAWHSTSPSNGVAIEGWNRTITAAAWTATPCPEGWRLPTHAELQALHNLPGDVSGKSGYWAAQGARGAVVAGRFYSENATLGQTTCTLPSSMTKCIFLPAAGYRSNTNGALSMQGSYGFYWSSTQVSATTAYVQSFNDTASSTYAGSKAAPGHTIRCVQ